MLEECFVRCTKYLSVGLYNSMLCCADGGKVEFVVDEISMSILPAKLEVSCVCPCTEGYYLFRFLGRGYKCTDEDIDRGGACIRSCVGD